jgi:hypothetical protein
LKKREGEERNEERKRERRKKEERLKERKKYPICSDELSEWEVIILFFVLHTDNGKETALNKPTFDKWKPLK